MTKHHEDSSPPWPTLFPVTRLAAPCSRRTSQRSRGGPHVSRRENDCTCRGRTAGETSQTRARRCASPRRRARSEGTPAALDIGLSRGRLKQPERRPGGSRARGPKARTPDPFGRTPHSRRPTERDEADPFPPRAAGVPSDPAGATGNEGRPRPPPRKTKAKRGALRPARRGGQSGPAAVSLPHGPPRAPPSAAPRRQRDSSHNSCRGSRRQKRGTGNGKGAGRRE